MHVNVFLTIAIAVTVFITSGLGGQLASKEPWHKWVFWGLGFVSLVLISAQVVINENDKPLTLKEAQDLLKQTTNAAPTQFAPTLSADDAGKAITKADFVKLLRQYQSTAQPSKLANLTNARVADMARAIALNLNELSDEWKVADHNAYMSIYDSLHGASEKNQQLWSTAPKRYADAQKTLATQYVPRSKDLLTQGNECRLEILSRLLPTQMYFDDEKGKTLYENLLFHGVQPDPGNLHATASYLDLLWKRLP
jgi:hypothetical protein